VGVAEERLSFTDASPRAFLEAEQANHPLAVRAGAVLEPRGELAPLFARMLTVVEATNEDPDGFRVTSRYVVATARR
jgi:hypothetical protein